MSANRFVWYELVTRDVDAAIGFYGKLLGWQSQDHPGGGERYAVLSASGKGVGGAMRLPEGVPDPCWTGYVGTPDIEATVEGFRKAGGAVHRGPWDIPEVGRLAIVGDPQGVVLALIQSASDRPSEAFNQQLPGHGSWHELHTPDPDGAFRFYNEQFGWTKGHSMDMGPMGTYQLFKAGDTEIGGMRRVADGMSPMWLYYFGVRSIDGAVACVRENGGEVLHEPHEVPGGAMIISARDPQGAMFALVGPN